MSRVLAHFRRTTAALIAWLAVLAGVGLSGVGAAQSEGFENGRASAIANGVTVDPRHGGLSFGITFGMALSDFTNAVARAESRSVDLGVIGRELAGEKCDGEDPTWPEEDQPQPLRVTSRDDGSADGRHEAEYGVFDKSVWATDEPRSESVTVIAPFGEPGVFEVGPVTTHTRTEVVDDTTRVAAAVTEIASITVGPLVELRGLRWEVINRGGAQSEDTAAFTVGSIDVAGTAVAPADTGAAAQLEALNDVLAIVGLRFEAPEMRRAGNVTFLSPLRVSVVPAEARDDLVGGLLAELQPVREQLVEGLVAADCGNATYVTVADLVVGSFSGAGALNLELGGVQASTGTVDVFRFGTPNVPLLGAVAGPPPAPAVRDGGGDPVPAPASPTSPPPAPVERALPITEASDTARGLLAAVAGAGLALSLLLAELDRRKMKAAQP